MEEVAYVLGPVTSLLMWRTANLGGCAMPDREGRQPSLGRCVGRAGEIRLLDEVRALGDVPIDVVVGDTRQAHRCASIDHVVLKGTLPPGSFCSLGGGVYVCSPELCLVLLGRGEDLRHLLELACELCGTYSVDPHQTGNFGNAPALTSRGRLASYVALSKGRHGCRLARRMVDEIRDGSDSPRETSMFLSFTLRSRDGGFGIRKPLLNERFEISERSSRSLGKGYLIGDEVFRGDRGEVIAVGEYDSKQHHFVTARASDDGLAIDVLKVIADDLRREIIRDEGIDIVTVRYEDTKSFDRFERKAQRLGKLVGTEPVPSEGILWDRRLDLFRYLFDTTRWKDEHQALRVMAGYERMIRHPRARRS